MFYLNNLLSTSSNPLVESHTIKKLNLFSYWVGSLSLLRRFVHTKWNDMCKQIRHWWKSSLARAKRLHVLHELIHTKFSICTFDIFILFLFYPASSGTNCLALSYRPRQCKKARFMYLTSTSFLRDLTNSGRPLVIRVLTQGRPHGQQRRQKTMFLLVEWGKIFALYVQHRFY